MLRILLVRIKFGLKNTQDLCPQAKIPLLNFVFIADKIFANMKFFDRNRTKCTFVSQQTTQIYLIKTPLKMKNQKFKNTPC